MYESSCYMDVKRGPPSPLSSIIKTEDFNFTQNPSDWSSYRFHQSTFEQLKQSVEKAKAALQDRTFLGTTSAFSDLYTTQRINETPENISASTTLSNSNIHNNNGQLVNSPSIINSNSINLSPNSSMETAASLALKTYCTNSSQTSTINHNHTLNNGQRLNSSLVTSHDSNLDSKSRQQSKLQRFKSLNFIFWFEHEKKLN